MTEFTIIKSIIEAKSTEMLQQEADDAMGLNLWTNHFLQSQNITASKYHTNTTQIGCQLNDKNTPGIQKQGSLTTNYEFVTNYCMPNNKNWNFQT